MDFFNFDSITDGSASFYGVREGMDTYSFDLQMIVFRSMVRDKVWIFTFFIRRYASLYALKQGWDFSFF